VQVGRSHRPGRTITASHDGPLTFATWFLTIESGEPKVGVIHGVEALLD
jgi:hypothetical protein